MSAYRARHPGGESLGFPTLFQALPHAEQGILTHVLGRVGISYDCECHGERCPGVPGQKDAERLLVARASGDQQDGVGAGVCLRRQRPPESERGRPPAAAGTWLKTPGEGEM
jgi:hypothetical protein